jgi:hypothetical protein
MEITNVISDVISDPKNVYTGYDPIAHIKKVANTVIPNTTDTTVLGISISCHGGITNEIVRNIPGVDIYKHNYAGYCASAIIYPLYNAKHQS